ncbi:MAG TPA: alpha/beta fold hydrolase [Vicinamibacterales bacterium]|nr:alpha/beta fold hydrolase [Vicinamibacterales bacterium]
MIRRLPSLTAIAGSVVAVAAIVAGACNRAPGVRGSAVARVIGPVDGTLANGDVRLSFRFEAPGQGDGPFPAFVIGHGSGEVRKEDCLGLAGNLLRRGFAILCYDKRGVGRSTGTYVGVDAINSHELIPDLAADMAAAVRFIRNRPEVDPRRVGLIGGSQAGWIIPHAARDAGVNFMILLVGPTVSVGEEIYFSKFAEETTTPLARLGGVLKRYEGPRGFDPRLDLEALDIPGLWLLAGSDRSIPTPETVAILDDLIAAGKPYERVVYPKADHSLRGTAIWPDIDRWLDANVAK